jgi:molybdopterin converting factor small subunit
VKLRVSYSGQARAAANCGSEQFELPASATLHDLLPAIASRHGEPMKALLEINPARGGPVVLVFLGEEQVRWDAPPPPLKDGDEVMLLSPISGG